MQTRQMSQLVTGEAVALDLRPAALPSRLLAGLIDAAILFGILFLLAIAGALAPGSLSEAAAGAIGVLVLVLVLVVYPTAFETLLRGRTPGKMAMGLRVVRDDGGPIGFRQALVRALAGAALERPGITFFVAGVVTSLVNSEGKRVGDLLAGTVVLRERVTAQGGTVAVMPPPLIGWAQSLELSGISDGLAVSMRQFVGRADSMTPAARDDLGARLVAAVTQAVGSPPPGTPGWAVLSAVLAERRRRETVRLATPPPGGYLAGPTGPVFQDRPWPQFVGPHPGQEPSPSQAQPGPGGYIAPF